MSNIVIELKAPEVVNAINNLINILSGNGVALSAPTQMQTQPQVTQSQPQAQQQIQNAPATQPPIMQPQIGQPQILQGQGQTQTFAQPQGASVPNMAPSVPTAGQTFTIDQLSLAATQLMDAGRKQDIVNLLSAFGVQALTLLPPEQYGNFATQLRAMGARI